MARLEFFLVAQSTSVDQATNALSIYHVVEQLRASQTPFVATQLVAVSTWLIEPEDQGNDYQVTLVITRPSGEEFHRFPHNFTARGRRQRILTSVQWIPLDAVGDWEFALLLNGEHKATHIVSVQLDDAEASQVVQVSPHTDSSGKKA